MAFQNDDDEILSSFVRTYQLHSTSPFKDELWVFSSSKDDEGSQNNSYSFSDDVGTRIISAFSKLRTEAYSSDMVQLWAPVTIDSRLLLSTYRQPFAVGYPKENLLKYRGHCEEYGYSINVNSNNVILDDMIEQDEDRRPKIITNGPPLSAFFSRLPELLFMKTSVLHEAGPLLGYGYEECGFKVSWMMPVWDPSRSSSSSSDCIGVLECSSPWFFDLTPFNLMKEALEEVGLRVFNFQDRIPYKNISGLKPTKENIRKALKTICVSHNICLAQVWISYDDDKHEHFSSSLMGTQMKQMLALKLTGYISSRNERCSDVFRLPANYYDACDKIPLKKGDELVLKTFQDYEPWFYEDNSKLGTDILLAEFSDNMAYSGLTICMRSIDTSDFDYVFEFIWCHNSDYVIFLEALLFTLKRHLPRFKCASGAELGDELHVIDADNSTKSETKKFKIFQGNGSSPTAEAMEKGKKAMIVDRRANTEVKCKTAKKDLPREVIEQQFGNTMIEAAENLQVSLSTLKRKIKCYGISEWQGRDLRKRKVYDSFNNQNCTNEMEYGAIQDPLSINRDENTLTIKAEYAGDTIKFDLPISEATFNTVKKEICMILDLTFETLKLKYRDEVGDWILLLSDKDMSYHMKSLKKLNQKEVRLCVSHKGVAGSTSSCNT